MVVGLYVAVQSNCFLHLVEISFQFWPIVLQNSDENILGGGVKYIYGMGCENCIFLSLLPFISETVETSILLLMDH